MMFYEDSWCAHVLPNAQAHLINSSHPNTRNILIPLKVDIFVGRLSLNRTPMKDIFFVRGINVPSSLCSICNDKVERVDHMLVYCNVAKEVLIKIAKWYDLGFVVVYYVGNDTR